jgi:hypothetical protein
MVNDQRILEEVDKTLESIGNDGILETNPFLLTRIQAEREARVRKHRFRLALRMNLGYIAIFVILLMNLITVVYYTQYPSDDVREQLISDLREDLEIDQSPYNF